MIFLDKQLDFLYFFQSFRTPFFTSFFSFLNFFDTDLFAFCFVVFVWMGVSTVWGKRLAFLLILDAWVNYIAKITFCLPRPFVFDSTLSLVEVGTRYGCPSGGAQMSLLLGLVMGYAFKKKIAWIVGISYGLLIGFSRLFLGVHFPLDVLSGWFLAGCMFYLFIRYMHVVELYLQKHALYALLLTIFSALAISVIFLHTPTVGRMIMAISLAMGIFIAYRMDSGGLPRVSFLFSFIRGIFGIFSSLFIYWLSFSFSGRSFIGIFFSGLWVSFFFEKAYHFFNSMLYPENVDAELE